MDEPGDGLCFDAGAGLDAVEGLFGAGHADVGDAEVTEVVLLVFVFAEVGELRVGLHAFFFEGFEDPLDGAVGVASGCDVSVGVAGDAGGEEDDGVVFEAFGFVDGFDDDLSGGGFVGAAFVEEGVESVEGAFVFVLVFAGVFAEEFEALGVALVVGGKFVLNLLGGPVGGAGVALEVAAVAELGG